MIYDSTRWHCLDILKSKKTDINTFNFDALTAPPLYNMVSYQDTQQLYYIATSLKYSSNLDKKFEAIDSVMIPRGFVRLSAGTNRLVYRYLGYDKIVLKVATDEGALMDSKREFANQQIFKPFVTKCFETDTTGVIGVYEMVDPITSREEFESCSTQILAEITGVFIGKYVMADIGAQFFLNWGIRAGFGPVLLDYPYAYELDGKKLYCQAPDQNDPTIKCGGSIDYDPGYSFLYCTKCGCRYRVSELAKYTGSNKIMVIGNPKFEKSLHRRHKKMKISVRKSGVKINSNDDDGFKNSVSAMPIVLKNKEPDENNKKDNEMPDLKKFNRGSVKLHKSWTDTDATSKVVSDNAAIDNNRTKTYTACEIADMRFNFRAYNPETKILCLESKETVIYIKTDNMTENDRATFAGVNLETLKMENEKLWQANETLSTRADELQNALNTYKKYESDAVEADDDECKCNKDETEEQLSEEIYGTSDMFNGAVILDADFIESTSLNRIIKDPERKLPDGNNIIVPKEDGQYIKDADGELLVIKSLNGEQLNDIALISKSEFERITGKTIEEYYVTDQPQQDNIDADVSDENLGDMIDMTESVSDESDDAECCTENEESESEESECHTENEESDQ